MADNSEKRKRCSNATDGQKKMLVEYMKHYPALISGKHSQSYTAKDAVSDWEEITSILNSGPGANKDWKGWRKTWHDIRSRTKMKESRNRGESHKTGGGPPKGEVLTTIDLDVLDLIKKVSVQDHDMPELVTDFNPEPTSDTTPPEHHIIAAARPVGTEEAGPCTSQIWEPSQAEEATPGEDDNRSCKTPNLKKLPKKLDHLLNSAVAATTFEANLRTKTELKKWYYEQKVAHMLNVEEIKLKKVEALRSIDRTLKMLARTFN